MGRHIKDDIVGKKFYRLLVLRHKYNIDKRSYFECLCDCGNIKIIARRHIGKAIMSCGCLRRETCGKRNWTGTNDISGEYINKIRYSATKKDISFHITSEDIWYKYESQYKLCALSGINIGFVTNYKNQRHLQTASIDRIDSHKGYTLENIQIVHKDINFIKSNLDQHTFFQFVSLVCCPIIGVCDNNTGLCGSGIDPHQTTRRKNCRGCGDISLTRYNKMIIDAESRGMSFDISIEHCWDLFIKQNKRCNITGLQIYFGSAGKPSGGTASLDRIDNKLGYTIDNIQWVHKNINRMKYIFSMEQFLYYCGEIYRFRHLNNNKEQCI